MGKKLGQHFLNNSHILEYIADAVIKRDGATIIEIGPGHGELTKKILSSYKNTCTFIAIERDVELAEKLKHAQFFKDGGARLVVGNALHELPKIIEEISTPFIVVGNIPYYITGHLLRVLGSLTKKPEQVLLVIQKEVAERIVAAPPKMNLLAACTQIWAIPTIKKIILRKEFSPPPNVDSALIELKTKKERVPDFYYETVKTIFAHPRKTLLNNLSSKIQKNGGAERLKKLNITPTVRPQNIGIEAIKKITEILK